MIHDHPPSCQVPQLKICLNGSSGRMGRRIDDAISTRRCGAQVTARRCDQRAILDEGAAFDVVIDFSSSEGAIEAANIALKAKCALLVGTTGLSDAARRELAQASRSIAVLVAPNTSVGIAVMRSLVARATALLGSEYEITISETHHTRKLDKPSGTALALAESIVDGGGARPDPSRIESIREGDVVGDHEVRFTSDTEVLTLRHHAKNRDLFALGAIRMASWIVTKNPGMYGLNEWFADLRKTNS